MNALQKLAFAEEQLGRAAEFYDTGRVTGASFYDARDAVLDVLASLEWILDDAAYKAPEQIGDVAQRWLEKLS